MKVGICILIAVFGLSPAKAIMAENEKSRELNEVQSKIQQIGADIKNLAAEKNAQLEQLKQLEKQYGELVNVLIAIKADIKQQEENIQVLRGKISVTQKNIRAQQQSIEGLVKSAYAIGNQEGLKVLLNQRDPSLSGRMLVYYNYISKARVQKLQAIQETFNALRQLESQKDNENKSLQIAMDKKKQEIEDMQALKIQREKLVAQLDTDYVSKKEQMDRLLHDEKKLEALVASFQKTDDNEASETTSTAADTIRKPRRQIEIEQEPSRKQQKIVNENLTNKAFADLQGQLPWPVQGMISEHFGSPRFETTWDGAVISAREGSDIHAVAAGRVVYADWLRGYGLMLIVDHGKGYMTLYAFNQSLHKNAGEQVRAGETLASVGRSGGRSQAALYFGIRKKGRPVDPEQWCRKSAKD